MRVLAAALLIAAGPMPALAAPAQGETAQPPRERIVCRRAVQTTTRAGARRACRTESEWRAMREGRPADETLAEDADTLEAMTARLSTGCLGGHSRIPQ